MAALVKMRLMRRHAGLQWETGGQIVGPVPPLVGRLGGGSCRAVLTRHVLHSPRSWESDAA